MTYKVEYMPEISEHAKRFIKLEVPKNMITKESEVSLYHIHSVLIGLESNNEDALFDKDIEYLNRLSDIEEINYIEF